MHPVLRFFTPLGRMRRRYYWLVLLGTMLLTSVTVARPMAIATINIPVLAALFGVVATFVHYIHFCIVAKRLHDMGRSAWWSLIAVASFAVSIAAERFAPAFWDGFRVVVSDWGAFHAISAPIWFAFWAWVGFWPGQQEDNRFGPSRFARGPILLLPRSLEPIHGASR